MYQAIEAKRTSCLVSIRRSSRRAVLASLRTDPGLPGPIALLEEMNALPALSQEFVRRCEQASKVLPYEAAKLQPVLMLWANLFSKEGSLLAGEEAASLITRLASACSTQPGYQNCLKYLMYALCNLARCRDGRKACCALLLDQTVFERVSGFLKSRSALDQDRDFTGWLLQTLFCLRGVRSDLDLNVRYLAFGQFARKVRSKQILRVLCEAVMCQDDQFVQIMQMVLPQLLPQSLSDQMCCQLLVNLLKASPGLCLKAISRSITKVVLAQGIKAWNRNSFIHNLAEQLFEDQISLSHCELLLEMLTLLLRNSQGACFYDDWSLIVGQLGRHSNSTDFIEGLARKEQLREQTAQLLVELLRGDFKASTTVTDLLLCCEQVQDLTKKDLQLALSL